MLGGEYTAFFVLIGYANFLYNIKLREIDHITKICIAGLSVSALSVLILLFIHWETVFSGIGRPQNTLIGIGWFGIAFMLIDAVRFQVKHYKISTIEFSKFVLITLFVLIVVKMNWIYFTGNGIELQQFFQITDRQILLLDINPNHVANIVVFQLALVIWLVIILMGNKLYKLYSVMAIAICIYMIFLLFVVNSRSTFVGVVLAIVVVTLLNINKPSKIAVISIFGIFLFIALIMPEFVLSRIKAGGMQIYGLLEHSMSDFNTPPIIDQQKSDLRNKIINILKDDWQKSDSKLIWDLCYTKNSPGDLDNR